MVFDLLTADGQGLRNDHYVDRRAALTKLDVDDGHTILVPPAYDGTLAKAIASSKKLGLEGVIAKRRESRYVGEKRSSSWIKIKHQRMQEVVIGGWKPGAGSRGGHDRLAAARHTRRRRPAVRRQGRHRLHPAQPRRPAQDADSARAQDQPVRRRAPRGRARCALGDARDRGRGRRSANGRTAEICVIRAGVGYVPTRSPATFGWNDDHRPATMSTRRDDEHEEST